MVQSGKNIRGKACVTPLTLAPAPGLDLQRLPQAKVEGLYVHIPFCFHKCHYCDFYSITRQGPERMERFVELILAEAEQWAHKRIKPTTAFFGGGTPTLLPENLMRKLLQGLCDRFDLTGLLEWTVEANPATVQPDYLQMLRAEGVDRLSFGAQSFNPAELSILERHHNPDDVSRSITLARSAGFTRLNVDLIYAIPGQTLTSWATSLDAALALKTPHISCYNLTYEPNTPMAVRKRLGHFAAVSEDVELSMLHHTRETLLSSGYRAYEVSNYAVPREECQHNLVYWRGENYVGLGPSAASHIEGWRWKNRPHLGEWERAIESNDLPALEVEHLSADLRAGELAMLMLRLDEGIQFDSFKQRLDCDARVLFAPQIKRLSRLGLISVDDRAIRLTESGLPVADAIAAEFLDILGPGKIAQ
jgi:oxygen-independent coproporphyrinogen-3 oxidase